MAPRVNGQLPPMLLPNAKADREPLQKLKGEARVLNPEAGEVLDLARGNVRLEPKAMAGEMGISHSLVLRGLKSADHLSFHRLYELSDEFWIELFLAVAKKRQLVGVDVTTAITIRRIA